MAGGGGGGGAVKPGFQKYQPNNFLKSSSIQTLIPLNSTFNHVSLVHSDAYK